MSIFKSILAKIFPTDHDANAPTKPDTVPTGQPTSTTHGTAGTTGIPAGGAATTGMPGGATDASGLKTTASPAGTAASSVDVDAVLRELQAKNTENLNWKTSIVDLLKLLGLDSSMAARRELAAELHYPGNTEDSAAMNMWLHKEVIRKLAENGGKLPEDLKH